MDVFTVFSSGIADVAWRQAQKLAREGMIDAADLELFARSLGHELLDATLDRMYEVARGGGESEH